MVNIALYVPLGVSGYLSARQRRPAALSAATTVAAGALLSTTIEFIQRWQPSRVPTLVDAISNTAGTCAGVILGAAVSWWLTHRHSTGRRTDTAAVALLAVMGAWLLFPFVPVLGGAALHARVSAFLHPGDDAWPHAVSTAGIWLVAGHMLYAVVHRRSALALAAAALLIPARILIIGHQPDWSEFAGALAACAIFAVRTPVAVSATLLIVILLLRGLLPGSQPGEAEFSWLPFGGFLGLSWYPAMPTMLEKILFYGAAVWAVARSGVNGAIATAGVALLLGAIEAAQVTIPGRTPEVTDPVLAIILGLLLVIQQRQHISR